MLRFYAGVSRVQAGERASVIGIDRNRNELWLELEKAPAART